MSKEVENPNTVVVSIPVPTNDDSKKDEKNIPKENIKPFLNDILSDEKKIEEESNKKAEIDMLVKLIQDPNQDIVMSALKTVIDQLRTSLSSVASIPYTLKFLRQHFSALEELYNSFQGTVENKKQLADILSVLSTTFLSPTKKALSYSIDGTGNDLTVWGAEYTRNITRDIIEEYQIRQQNFLLERENENFDHVAFESRISDLLNRIDKIVPYYIDHHNYTDAIDFLIEVHKHDWILKYIDNSNYKRVAKYLTSLAYYSVCEEDLVTILDVVFNIYVKLNKYCEAVRIALKLRDSNRLLNVIENCTNPLIKKQIGFILGSYRWNFSDDEYSNIIATVGSDVAYGMNNEWLSSFYKELAKDLDVQAAKTPQDVYKNNFEDKKKSNICLDSAKQNLSSTIVNAFINTGFGNDSLMTAPDSNWLYKNKDNGMTTAVGSLGAIFLWDNDFGLSSIDKYQWSSDVFIKAGALMAFGLVSAGVRTEGDIAFSLIADNLESENSTTEQTISALLGLCFSHIGVPRPILLDLLTPMVIDTNLPDEVSALSALVLSLSYTGTGNDLVAEAIIQTLLDRQYLPGSLDSPLSYLFSVSLGLLFLSCNDACETVCEALDVLDAHTIGKFAKSCIRACAYAGTADTSKIQMFLKLTSQDLNSRLDNQNPPKDSTTSKDNNNTSIPEGLVNEESSKATLDNSNNNVNSTNSLLCNEIEQSSACLAIAILLVGHDIGSNMILRMFDHMLQYGSLALRKGVPLALAILSASSAKPAIIEILSKLSHDTNIDVANNAIFALGIIGAGTNNARIAKLLRELAVYYAKTTNTLFIVRISQGILYLGKGLLTISSVHSDGFLINYPSLCSLLVILYTSLFMKSTILSRYHYLLYFIVAGARPRMLITVDESLKPLPVLVRVGQALDTAALAGNPRTITGFQTQTTPILLGDGERAELATSEYVIIDDTPLEGVVILKKAISSDIV